MTPTDRTRAWYTSTSTTHPRPVYVLGRVERHIKPGFGAGFRKDLFGLFDFIGMRHGEPLLGIQSCDDTFKAHFDKMTVDGAELLALWLSTGANAELISWRRRKAGMTCKIHRF